MVWIAPDGNRKSHHQNWTAWAQLNFFLFSLELVIAPKPQDSAAFLLLLWLVTCCQPGDAGAVPLLWQD